MNYARNPRKTYAVRAAKIAASALFVSVIAYGFLVVGVVKAAAAKQQYADRQAEASAELNSLEQELMAMKSGVSLADPSAYALSDLSGTRRIIDVHSLGVAYRGR